MGIEFDEEKWKEIERQWADDDAHAEPDAEPDADADDAMVLPEMDFTEPEAPAPALRLRDTSPATAGAGQKGARPSVAEPAASRPPIASLDWKGLGDRLSLAELGKSQSKGYESMLANAGNSGQYVQNQNAGNVGPAVVRGEMEVNRERQGSDARDLSMQGQKAALGVKSAMSDPNSLQSQKAREAVRAMGVKTPSGFDNYSADDIQRFVKTGELARLEESRARSANAAADDQRKMVAAQEKSGAEKATLEQMRKTWAPEFKKAGIDPTTATKFDLERVLQMRGQDTTAAALTHREGEDEKKKTEDVPPDYEVTPGGNPGPDSRKKFTALVASRNKLKLLTKAMRAEMQGVGLKDQLAPGKKRDRLNQLATQIGIEGKNVAELGALSGPDMELMNAMVKNPTSVWNVFSDMASNMDGLDSWADSSVQAGSDTYGIRKRAGVTDDPMVTLMAKDGKRVKRVKRSAAEAFLRANPGEATLSE